MEKPRRVKTTPWLSRNCSSVGTALGSMSSHESCPRVSDMQEAQAHRGPTVFEWLTEIIRDHGPGGRQAADGVDLLLD
jgi:hypothetical protein